MYLQRPTQNWASIFQPPGHWEPGTTSHAFKGILIIPLNSRHMFDIWVYQGFWLMECVLIAMNLFYLTLLFTLLLCTTIALQRIFFKTDSHILLVSPNRLFFFLHMFPQKAKTKIVLLRILFFVTDLFGKLRKSEIIYILFVKTELSVSISFLLSLLVLFWNNGSEKILLLLVCFFILVFRKINKKKHQ